VRHDRPDGWHQPDEITVLAPAYELDADVDELWALMRSDRPGSGSGSSAEVYG
jgi:hypothetical protein